MKSNLPDLTAQNNNLFQFIHDTRFPYHVHMAKEDPSDSQRDLSGFPKVLNIGRCVLRTFFTSKNHINKHI